MCKGRCRSRRQRRRDCYKEKAGKKPLVSAHNPPVASRQPPLHKGAIESTNPSLPCVRGGGEAEPNRRDCYKEKAGKKPTVFSRQSPSRFATAPFTQGGLLCALWTFLLIGESPLHKGALYLYLVRGTLNLNRKNFQNYPFAIFNGSKVNNGCAVSAKLYS